ARRRLPFGGRDRVSAMATTAGGPASQRTVVVLGTATPGGGLPVYGAAGAVDIALVQGEVAHEAFNGIGRPPANLKIVAAMYSTPGMFVVSADSQYRRVEDLRGESVVFGARGSGLVILSRYVLDGLGLDQ